MNGDGEQHVPGDETRGRNAEMLDLLRKAGEQVRGERAPAQLQARLEGAYAMRMHATLRAGDATRMRPLTRSWAFGLAAACGVAAVLLLAPWRSVEQARPAAAPIANAGQPPRVPTETDAPRAQALAPLDDRNAAGRATARPRDVAMTVAAAGHRGPVIGAAGPVIEAAPSSTTSPEAPPANAFAPEDARAPSHAPTPDRALAHALPPERDDDAGNLSLSDLTALPSDPSALRIATTAPPLPRFPDSAPRPPLRAPTLAPPTLPTMAPPGEAPPAQAPATLPPAQAVSATAARAIATTSPVRAAGTHVRFEFSRPAGHGPAAIRSTPASSA